MRGVTRESPSARDVRLKAYAHRKNPPKHYLVPEEGRRRHDPRATPEYAVAYFNEALEPGETIEVFLLHLRDVADALGGIGKK